MKYLLVILLWTLSAQAAATITTTTNAKISATPLSLKEKLEEQLKKNKNKSNSLIFDLPVTYNNKVKKWVSFYQTNGRKWFRTWLERSYAYLPGITEDLKKAGLPQDLAYMVMIESGFSMTAESHMDAVGPWQFIRPTGERYGLTVNWWLDERCDMKKSTKAAIGYISDLYQEFNSWYLVAASYNMGETGLRRQIQKHGTKDFWALSRLGALPDETMEYVPKILAAMLISKSPNLYGFRDIAIPAAIKYDVVAVAGGMNIDRLADYLGVTKKYLRDLNAELVLGYVPQSVKKHFIRVPVGSGALVSKFVNESGYKVATSADYQ